MRKPRYQVVQQMADTGIIAILRTDETEKILRVMEAIGLGGVTCIEVPVTVPNGLKWVEKAAGQLEESLLFGAGSVLDAETARLVIAAGVDYIVTPTLNPDTIKMAHRYGIAVVVGAFTPTEIITAWEHGADMVKVFPGSLGGPQYIKEIHAPLPQVLLAPTGGVTIDNAADFIRAGACCLGVGSALLDKTAIAVEDYTTLTQKAQALVQVVRNAKQNIFNHK